MALDRASRQAVFSGQFVFGYMTKFMVLPYCRYIKGCTMVPLHYISRSLDAYLFYDRNSLYNTSLTKLYNFVEENVWRSQVEFSSTKFFARGVRSECDLMLSLVRVV